MAGIGNGKGGWNLSRGVVMGPHVILPGSYAGMGVVYPGGDTVTLDDGGDGQDHDLGSLPVRFEGLCVVSSDVNPVIGLELVWSRWQSRLLPLLQPRPSVFEH